MARSIPVSPPPLSEPTATGATIARSTGVSPVNGTGDSATSVFTAHGRDGHATAGDPLSETGAAQWARIALSLRWQIALILVAVVVRTPGLHRPLLGNFATKNAVYGMIARNWAFGRAPLGRPTLDVLAGGERAWHLLEWPASAYLSGLLWKCLGGSLDFWGRATSVGWSALAVGLLFWLVNRWHGRLAATGAAAVYALSPVSVIYGQSFMLEASVGCLSIASFCAVQRWLDSRRARWLLSGTICMTLLFLTKIYMVVLLLPLGALVWQSRQTPPQPRGRLHRRGIRLDQHEVELANSHPPGTPIQPVGWRFLAFAIAALFAIIPTLLWYLEALRLSEPGSDTAQHIYYSLRQSTAVHAFPSPLLFQPGFYCRLLLDLGCVTLTPVGLLLAAAGCVHRDARRHLPWILSMVLLIVVLPLKFFAMNYYHLVTLAPWAVLAGLGCQALAEASQRLSRWILSGWIRRGGVVGLVMFGVLLSIRLAARPAFVTPHEDRQVVAAAEAVQRWMPPDESVITMHGSTIDLLYYCDRKGWAISSDSPSLHHQLDDCLRQGAHWLVVCDSTTSGALLADWLARSNFRLVEARPGYAVYRL